MNGSKYLGQNKILRGFFGKQFKAWYGAVLMLKKLKYRLWYSETISLSLNKIQQKLFTFYIVRCDAIVCLNGYELAQLKFGD